MNAVEVRRSEFALGDEWFVAVGEWSDGIYWMYAVQEHWEPWPTLEEYDGLEFDHAPTVDEILSALESEQEARFDRSLD